MRFFPVAFGVAIIVLGALLLFFVYYAVASIWGYDREGPQWQYAVLAAGELILGTLLIVSGFRVLRAGFGAKRHPE